MAKIGGPINLTSFLKERRGKADWLQFALGGCGWLRGPWHTESELVSVSQCETFNQQNRNGTESDFSIVRDAKSFDATGWQKLRPVGFHIDLLQHQSRDRRRKLNLR